jgi:hypothetical protein
MLALVITLIALPAMFVVWMWWPGRRDADVAGPLMIVAGVVACAVSLIAASPRAGLAGLLLLAVGFATAAVVHRLASRR